MRNGREEVRKIRVCASRMRRGTRARSERGESDDSMLFDRTNTVTFRASCSRRGERDMERTPNDELRKKGKRARDATRSLPVNTNALLERQHPTEVHRSTEAGAE